MVRPFFCAILILCWTNIRTQLPGADILILGGESSGEKPVGLETTDPRGGIIGKIEQDGTIKLRVGDWHKTLSESYDKDERPTELVEGPTLINISIWIVKIYSISEAEMAYSIDLYYQEIWRDQRLKYAADVFGNQTEISIPSRVLSQIWQPDTYFPSARTIKEPDARSVTHTAVLKLGQDGQIWYSRRLALSADCPMDLTFYPFDKQGCKLRIGSYGQTVDKLLYQWRDFKPIVFEEMVLPEFRIISDHHRDRVLEYISGNYSSIEFCFIIERNFGYCLIQLVIPACAVVMSSWVALWLQDETEFSDVIAVILAIIFLSYANNSSMPRVSYVKLMDIYLGACFLFVFISLGKLVLLKYLKRQWQIKHAGSDAESWAQHMNQGQINNWHLGGKAEKRQKRKESSRSQSGDSASSACYFQCLSCFHITTQLLLPLAYGGFMVAVLILMPKFQKKVMCD